MNRYAAIAVALLAGLGMAADWPQFQGPDRNNVSAEKGLLQAWPPGGPQLENTAAMRSSLAAAQRTVLPSRECPWMAILLPSTILSVSR